MTDPAVHSPEELAEERGRRLRCLLVGAMIGQQSARLVSDLDVLLSVASYGNVPQNMLEGQIRGLTERRRTLAKLVSQGLNCGLPGEAMIGMWDRLDAELNRLLNTPQPEFARGTRAFADEFVRGLEAMASQEGVDPPVSRNIRRIIQAQPPEERRG